MEAFLKGGTDYGKIWVFHVYVHRHVRLSTVTHPSWVALYSMAHSFTELEQAVVHVIRLVNFL